MTNNFQPAEDIFDDVEGHGISSNRIETPETDDVEAHGISSGRIETPETDDVEGHMPRIRVGLEADETDDVEGHMPLRKI